MKTLLLIAAGLWLLNRPPVSAAVARILDPVPRRQPSAIDRLPAHSGPQGGATDPRAMQARLAAALPSSLADVAARQAQSDALMDLYGVPEFRYPPGEEWRAYASGALVPL